MDVQCVKRIAGESFKHTSLLACRCYMLSHEYELRALRIAIILDMMAW